VCADVLLSSRYDLVTQNKNWDNAQIYCQTHYRAKLAVIADSADQLRLLAYLETINGQPLCCVVVSTAYELKLN